MHFTCSVPLISFRINNDEMGTAGGAWGDDMSLWSPLPTITILGTRGVRIFLLPTLCYNSWKLFAIPRDSIQPCCRIVVVHDDNECGSIVEGFTVFPGLEGMVCFLRQRWKWTDSWILKIVKSVNRNGSKKIHQCSQSGQNLSNICNFILYGRNMITTFPILFLFKKIPCNYVS